MTKNCLKLKTLKPFLLASHLTVGILGICFPISSMSMPQVNYQISQRILYLEKAFNAFQRADNVFLSNTLRLLRNQNRYQCSAQSEQLRVQCLIQQSNQNCSEVKNTPRDVCNLVSDVIASNLIEEGSFITRQELGRILRNVRGTRDQLLTAINGRYARLTTDFYVDTVDRCPKRDAICLASGIDHFCLKRADQKTMSWQGCAGAILWFIGSNLK